MRFAAYDLITLLEDQVGDLTQALKQAGIPIPVGFSAGERAKRVAYGTKLMGLPLTPDQQLLLDNDTDPPAWAARR